jgi:alpha 1,6-mannosyltransferase
MASARSHPIVLSAVLRIFHTTARAVDWTHHHALRLQQYEDQGKTGSEAYKELKRVNGLEQPSMGGAIGVLDWTGPGLYTDAVMRSILYQHVLEQSRTRLTSTAT